MKKLERIAALKAVEAHNIEVKRLWWDPLCGITWKVMESTEVLSEDQYRYLTQNKLVDKTAGGDEVAILSITELGRSKLLQLSSLAI